MRRSLRIKAACYSGVSHGKVRRIAKAEKLSHALRRKHVRYLAHVCREGGLIKSVCFGPGPRFRALNDKRRVGKPRQKWASSVFMNAQAALWYYGHTVGNFGRVLDRLSSQRWGNGFFRGQSVGRLRSALTGASPIGLSSPEHRLEDAEKRSR